MANVPNQMNVRGYGLVHYVAPTSQTYNLNAAVNRFALAFVIGNTETLNKARIYVSAVSGTLGANDLVMEIYANASGSPTGAALASSNTLSGGAPTGAGFIEFSGFNLAITAGVEYWAVLKNVNAVPGTNYITIRYSANGSGPMTSANSNACQAWGKKVSTDSGSTWGTANASVYCLRLEFAGSKYAGASYNTAGSDANRVYATRMVGSTFTTPAQTKLKICGIQMYILKQGTPTGTPFFSLYKGTTLVASTHTVSTDTISTSSQIYIAFFASEVELDPNSVYRIVLAETAQADTSGNNYGTFSITWDTDTASQAFKDFSGTAALTYYDGSNWTDNAGYVVPFQLLLKTDSGWANNSDTIPASSILNGNSYVINGSTVTGTLLSTDPGAANVLSGTAYVINNSTYTGSLHIGTYTDPGAANVVSATTYIFNDVTQTGTYNHPCDYTDPGVTNVAAGVSYIFNGTTLTGLAPLGAVAQSAGSLDLNGIKSQIQTYLNDANTTTAAIDLSRNMATRVQKVFTLNPNRIRIQANLFPFVTIWIESKPSIEDITMAKAQNIGKRKAEIEIKIAGATWNSTIPIQTGDDAADDAESLMESIEAILRTDPQLGKRVSWSYPNQVTYHNVDLEEGAHLRTGILTLRAVAHY